MKKEKSHYSVLREGYSSPLIEEITVRVEQGFAISIIEGNTGGIIDDFGFENE